MKVYVQMLSTKRGARGDGQSSVLNLEMSIDRLQPFLISPHMCIEPGK